jgi:hypothetical protein
LTVVTTVVVSLIAALVSAVLTYFTARRDLQLKFDASLRGLRIGAYKELWKELDALAKYGRPDALSRSKAEDLRDSLRDWYYDSGGLVLSTETRGDYFRLLDGLELVINHSTNIMRDADDEFLRVLGSRLRTAMTRDVGTRRTFIFRGDPEREEPHFEEQAYVDDSGTRHLVITSKRRLALARRLGLRRAALTSSKTQLQLPKGAQLMHWDPARKTFTVKNVAADSADDAAEERLFLLEDGYIVEGPTGWRRRGEARRCTESVIWEKRDRPFTTLKPDDLESQEGRRV